MTKNSASHFDRRRQPQKTLSLVPFITQVEAITTLKDVVASLGDWDIKELTVQKYIHPSGSPVNESYGVDLVIPPRLKEVADFRQLWLGYLSHANVTPGVYAGLTAWPASATTPALRNGYRESPFRGEFILLKQLITETALTRIARRDGKTGVVLKLTQLIKNTYPFSLKP